MAVAFRDFYPQTLNRQLLGLVREFENLYEVVTRINQWIEAYDVRVVNIETLLMPVRIDKEDHSAAGRMENNMGTQVAFQVVRVWYLNDGSIPNAYLGATRQLDLEQLPPEARE